MLYILCREGMEGVSGRKKGEKNARLGAEIQNYMIFFFKFF